MKKYILGYYRYHKISTAVILLLTVLFTCIVICINTLVDHVASDNINKLKDKYGEYHVIIHDPSESDVEFLSGSDRVEKIGQYVTYGNYSISGTDYHVTIGSFDENAIELGRIKLIDGTFPSTDDEICLEDHYRYYLYDDPLELGDNIELVLDSCTKSFRICGFIEDYSGCWLNIEELVVGYNDYPSGLVLNDDRLYSTEILNYLVFFSGTSQYNVPSSIYTEFVNNLNAVDNQVFNDEVYSNYFQMMMAPVLMYRNIFLFLYLFVGVFLFYNLFSVYVISFDNNLYTFQAIGLSKKRSSAVSWILTSILYAAGVLTGLLISFLFFLLFRNGLFFRDFISKTHYLLIVILVYIASRLILHFRLNRKNPREREEKEFRHGYVIGFVKINIKKRYVSFVTLLLVLAFSMSAFFCIDIDKKNRDEQYVSSKYNEIIAISNPYSRIAQAGTYEISSYQDGYDLRHIRKLYGLLKDRCHRFSYSFDINNYLMLPDDTDDRYWNTIRAEWFDNTGWVPSTIDINQVPNGPRERIGTQVYSVFTVTESNKDSFMKCLPEIDIDRDLAPGKVILFVAPRKESILENKGDLLVEDYYKPGDTIQIAKIYSSTTLEEAERDPSVIRFVLSDLTISKVYRENFNYINEDGEASINNFPRIVWTEETADQCESVFGVDKFRVKVSRDLSDEEYHDLIVDIYRVGYSTKNSIIHETKFKNDFLDNLYLMINICYLFCVVLIAISVGISLYSLFYISLSSQKRSFGILRTIGIRKKSVFTISLLEYLVYWCSGLFITPLISCITMRVFIDKALGALVPFTQLTGYFVIISEVYLVLIAGIALACYIFTKRLFKQSITDAVNYGE
ncbi:MAG: ABC transporter permease [Clostridia bacterium]|nr:ABC transporter permease [Clostridia bacterium]